MNDGSQRTPGARVLIVEDERVVATHVERSLRDAGYVTLGIATTEAEAEALTSRERPDVALVDIRLRGPSEGFSIARRLRESADVPVVYMTAHTDDDTLQRAAQTGAYGYVVKPFTIGEVKSALEVALHKHRLDVDLRERERWFSTTLRAIDDGVVACDPQQRVTLMNPTAERLLGCTEAEARGRAMAEVLPAALATAIPEALAGAAGQGSVRLALDVQLRTPAGTTVVEGTVAEIAHGGRSLGSVLVLHDVTEQRRRDEQVALTDRLSSLGTLVASVAHEINNPLAYGMGNLELAGSTLQRLLARVEDASLREQLERIANYLHNAEDGTSRIASTVKELRAFGRVEESSQHPIDPRACVGWAIRLTSNQILHQARLYTALQAVPLVTANELKLSQVIVNLLNNAVQALTGQRETNEIRVSTWAEETGTAVIEVADNGCGMSPELLASAFDPFVTTKTDSHGSGLGLSISRSIVRSFGGEISVESEPDRGSRFQVRLPAAPSAAEPARGSEPGTERRPPSSIPPTHRASVLVVDDEAPMRALVTDLLRDKFQVESAGCVREALATLNRPVRHDVILCDLMMPGESGMDFFSVVRRLYPELLSSIVFITGGAITPHTSEFLATSGRPVLHKPFSFQALLAQVEGVLQERGSGVMRTAAASIAGISKAR